MTTHHFEEACAGPDVETWKRAMLELWGIEQNEMWRESPLPLDRKALGTKWVLTIKHDAQGNIERFKARLVVQGFGQEFGFDYDETYAQLSISITLDYFLRLGHIIGTGE